MASDPSQSLGEVLANLSSSCYSSPNGDGRFLTPNCTWYCWGRANEKYGINLQFTGDANACDWYNHVNYDPNIAKVSSSSTPITDSVAVFSGGSEGDGHVLYIEAVRSDFTYYTEYNFIQSENGKLQRFDTSTFANVKGSNFTLQGYIEIR
jgi:surface antigen